LLKLESSSQPPLNERAWEPLGGLPEMWSQEPRLAARRTSRRSAHDPEVLDDAVEDLLREVGEVWYDLECGFLALLFPFALFLLLLALLALSVVHCPRRLECCGGCICKVPATILSICITLVYVRDRVALTVLWYLLRGSSHIRRGGRATAFRLLLLLPRLELSR
jgi:hypothetical protein